MESTAPPALALWIVWTILCNASCSSTATAPPPAREELSRSERARTAITYLEALRDADWLRVEELADPEIWYFDPTMEIFERPAIDLHGRDAMLAFYRDAHEQSGTSEVRWEIVDGFEAIYVSLRGLCLLGNRFQSTVAP